MKNISRDLGLNHQAGKGDALRSNIAGAEYQATFAAMNNMTTSAIGTPTRHATFVLDGFKAISRGRYTKTFR